MTNYKTHQNVINLSQKGKGVLDFQFGGNEAEPHQNTFRVILVGPSNSGKTTAFTNLIPDFPRPIKSITYIAPYSSHLDEGPIKLKTICEKVGINWNSIKVEDKKPIEIPNTEKPEIVVFDDLWKYKRTEPLIDEVFIRGRHDQRHGVYMAQTPAYVPTSARNNYSHCVLHKDFFNEDTEKKFHFNKGSLEPFKQEGLEDPNKNFMIFRTGGIPIGWYIPPKFKTSTIVLKIFKNIKGGGRRGIRTSPKIEEINKKEEALIKTGIEAAGNNNVDYTRPIFKQEIKNNDLFKKYFYGKI
jgi:hypothetical protein